MLLNSEPEIQRLDNGLILRALRDEDDIEQVAQFNGFIHSEEEISMTRNLIHHHPASKPEYWLMVEDQKVGEIVATLCLIPWRLHFGPVELRAGEMGIVGTHPDYRRRGLQRVLARRHRELLIKGGFHLSHIQGIAYFYRQFGYEYAIPLEGGTRIELHQIKTMELKDSEYGFRLAEETDIPDLMRLYEQYATTLTIHTVRDAGIWQYLLGPSTETGTAAETWLVQKEGRSIGYFRVEKYGFGDGLNVNECSDLRSECYPAVLDQLKALAMEREKPFIRLNISSEHALVKQVLGRGAHSLGHYAWQLYLPNIPQLLMALKPVFEQRLTNSPFSVLHQPVVIDLYREAYTMHFVNGLLERVTVSNTPEGAILRMPPQLLAPLIVGHHTYDALRAMYPDVNAGDAAPLVNVLFPRLTAFMHTIY